MNVYAGFEPYAFGEKQRLIETIVRTSPIIRALGVRFLDLEPGFVRLELAVREEFLNHNGVVHGGIVAALADTAVAFAAKGALPPGSSSTSVELKINFIRPVMEGRLTGEGRLIHMGRRTAVVEARVLLPDGKLVAHCVSTLMVLPTGAPVAGADT
ncbi:MAG: PaaI family thioesterase [Candidatus Lambdaproteobacteria bacterium]|nr:PaaI family thioesterase [Candidatus Lambdaproteobacteria bacterium]